MHYGEIQSKREVQSVSEEKGRFSVCVVMKALLGDYERSLKSVIYIFSLEVRRKRGLEVRRKNKTSMCRDLEMETRLVYSRFSKEARGAEIE